jgi:cell wall-associated NlpC family hydrolase
VSRRPVWRVAMVVEGRVARTAVRVLLVGLLAGLVGVGAGPAVAVHATPTDRDIERARQVQSDAATAVALAEERLAAVSERLAELIMSAAQVAEAHNGAQYALQGAQAAESRASTEAAHSRAVADEAQAELGRVAATAYRTGGQLAVLAAVIDADRSGQFVDGTTALQTAARSQGAIADRAAAAAAEANRAAERARQARQDRRDAALAAEAASARAAQAVVEYEAHVTALEEERDQALADLAEARGTTVALEEDRRVALAMAAAADAESTSGSESAGDSGEGAGTASPAATSPGAEPSAAGPASSPAPSESTSPARSSTPSTSPSPAGTRTATPAPSDPSATPSPQPAPNPPSVASGAQRAIDYARAQLGKPYEWGAAGPDSFDCSGLTMRAWQQAGVQLPHWSVAQARLVTKISYADLAPGDLIFWSDNGQPSGTYHVGLYIGGGKMIHAPRPGKAVEIQNVFYWRSPSFYGRV